MSEFKSHEFAPFNGRSGFPLLLSAWGLTGNAVEVGTHRGEFAHTLLHNWPGHLTCVDPWSIPDGYGDQARLLPSLGGNGFDRWADYRECRDRLNGFGDRVSYRVLTSVEAAPHFVDESLDFVYVDGDHRKEQVALDLELWWPKLKPGGVLAGHDYVTLNDPTGYPGIGVREAVDEFVQFRNVPGTYEQLTVFVVREFTDQPWSWYLVKPVPPQAPEVVTDDRTGSTTEDGPAGSETGG